MADRNPAFAPRPDAASVATERVSVFWTWVALLFALVGVWGTLWLSIALDLIACPLCFYQRTFLMSAAAVLLVGLIAGQRRSGFLSLVTLPLTVAALGIAGFHVYKEYNNDPPGSQLECPTGVLALAYENWRGDDDIHKQLQELLTAPKESAILLSLLFLVQLVDVLRSGSRGGFGFGALLAVLIVGGGLGYGAWQSMGPGKIPPAPAPLQGCRPPAPQVPLGP